MPQPNDIDPEAAQILVKAGLNWSDVENAFIEKRFFSEESTVQYIRRYKLNVSYEYLRNHGLAGTIAMGQHRLDRLLELREKVELP